jgi:hypothetical protein
MKIPHFPIKFFIFLIKISKISPQKALISGILLSDALFLPHKQGPKSAKIIRAISELAKGKKQPKIGLKEVFDAF